MTYLNELEQALQDLPEEKRAQIIKYYQEKLSDQIHTDEERETVLGEPAELAKKLVKRFDEQQVAAPKQEAEAVQGDAQAPAASEGRPSWSCRLIFWVTAILWAPLLLTTYVLILTLGLVAWVLELSVILSAAFVGIAGVVVLSQAFWGALFYIGTALVLLGVAVLFLPVTIWTTTKVIDWMKSLTMFWIKYVKKEA